MAVSIAAPLIWFVLKNPLFIFYTTVFLLQVVLQQSCPAAKLSDVAPWRLLCIARLSA
jgi:hypothetical protein